MIGGNTNFALATWCVFPVYASNSVLVKQNRDLTRPIFLQKVAEVSGNLIISTKTSRLVKCPRILASRTYQREGWWNIIIWPDDSPWFTITSVFKVLSVGFHLAHLAWWISSVFSFFLRTIHPDSLGECLVCWSDRWISFRIITLFILHVLCTLKVRYICRCVWSTLNTSIWLLASVAITKSGQGSSPFMDRCDDRLLYIDVALSASSHCSHLHVLVKVMPTLPKLP